MYEGVFYLCVCCMSAEDLKDPNSYKSLTDDTKVNYANMLKSCFNIKIYQADGHEFICEECSRQLEQCVEFKKQALKSIAILSSVDLTELVNAEDLQNLGLLDSVNVKQDPLRDSYKEKELVSDHERVEERSIDNNYERVEDDSSNDQIKNQIKEKQQTLQRKTKTKNKKRKLKEKVTKFKMPYEISKEDLKCKECGEEFGSHHTLRIHYNSHFGNYGCKECNKKYMTQESLRKHEKAHLRGPFPCEVCGQIFTSIHTLKTHKLRQHDKRPQYKCHQCDERFTSSWRRERHKQLDHGNTEARFKCNYCEERFMDGIKLSKHISNQHKLKLFPCPICGVRYKPANLRLHLLSGHGIGKGCRCPVPSCGAMRSYRSGISKHLRSHLNDRRFVCKLCSKAFVQKCALKNHIKVHVRRGEFNGDPDSLVTYVEDAGVIHRGLLDLTEYKEQKSETSDSYPTQSLSLDTDSIDLDADSSDLDEVLLDDDRFQLPSDLES